MLVRFLAWREWGYPGPSFRPPETIPLAGVHGAASREPSGCRANLSPEVDAESGIRGQISVVSETIGFATTGGSQRPGETRPN